MIKKYLPLLEGLAENLERKIVEGKYKLITKETYIGDAHRIFESVVAELSEKELLNLMEKRGFKVQNSSYSTVIKKLKEIICQRQR